MCLTQNKNDLVRDMDVNKTLKHMKAIEEPTVYVCVYVQPYLFNTNIINTAYVYMHVYLCADMCACICNKPK